MAEKLWDQRGGIFDAVEVGSSGSSGSSTGEARLQLQWVRTNPTTSDHGATGWAKSEKFGTRRIHACAHSPCQLRVATKLGIFKELPTHVRRVPAVPAPPRGSSLKPLGNALGTVGPGAGVKRATLPAAAKVGIGGGGKTGVLVAGGDAAPSMCATSTLVEQVVALSREMRRPGQYVGLVAFLLFALKRKIRVRVWIGAECVDLLGDYAPWALPFCKEEALAKGILCSVHRDEATGISQVLRITDDESAMVANHFVAGLPCGASHHDDGEVGHHDGVGRVEGQDDDEDLVGYYTSLGSLVAHTVRDGDCAFDAMRIMAGEPRTAQVRKQMRREINDYTLKHVENAALHRALKSAGELSVPHDGGDSLVEAHAPLLFRDGDSEASDASSDVETVAVDDPRWRESMRTFPDEVVEAMAWASGLATCDKEKAIALCRSLPSWRLDEQLKKYRERDNAQEAMPNNVVKPKPSAQGKHISTRLLTRNGAARMFNEFLKKRGIDISSGQPLPWGAYTGYLRANRALAASLKSPKDKRKHRAWLLRAVRAMQVHGDEPAGAIAIKLPRDSGYGKDGPVWTKVRRRRRGKQGRPQKAPLVRSLLFEWFSVLRNSVSSRIPTKLVVTKASTLVEDYVKECLLRGVTPDPPDVKSSHWLNGWTRQYRISLRRPNRKYKVPLGVLQERLAIFWANIARVRKFIQLTKGYDPHMTNIDQSPYRKNEAGSQGAMTLNLKGAPKVVLKEGHADTRARWTSNATTCSDFRGDVPDWPIPALEFLFKAEGERLEQRLKGHIRASGYPRWLTVATGPKGSHREEHILNFLEATLEPWYEGREWRILGLDAFAPQMTDNVRRMAWSRGYIVVIHGGGTTGITQTNDTDLRQHQRRNYTQKEMAETARLARLAPGKMPSAMVEQCIDWMADVWSDRRLRDQARKGFKYTGATNALDGSEDHLISREAREFWDKLGMSAKRDAACHDVFVEVSNGRLRWGYDAVYSMVAPFPHRGILDTTDELQDDEEVAPADEEKAWSGDEAEDVDDDDGGEADTGNEDEEQYQDHGASDAEEGPECKGPAPHPCDGGDAALTAAQADSLCEQSSRISALKQSIETLELHGLSAAAESLRRALHEEVRASVGARATDAGVAKAMRDDLGREERALAAQQRRVRKEMEAKRTAKKAKVEAKTMQARVAVVRRKLREAREMEETLAALKTFTPAMLGDGRARGGGDDCRKRRKEVLQRLAAKGAPFSARGKNDWTWFVAAWGAKMSEEHGAKWGQVFAEWMQNLGESLAAGNANAVADFMASEINRVLQDVSALQV